MLAGRLQRLCSPLAECISSSGGGVAEALRAFSSSSSLQRMLREPLQPSRAPGVQEGGEKPELVNKMLGAEFMSRRDRNRVDRQKIIDGYERFPGDTGSTEVQVALLTQKIKDLAAHMQQHKKDFSSRRGLEAMLHQRRKLLMYLRRTKFDTYAALILRLGLKDSYAPQDRYSSRYKAADRSRSQS